MRANHGSEPSNDYEHKVSDSCPRTAMKAIVQTAYGSPDVLELRDIDIPTIDDNGILVEGHAAAVNALDWHATRGMPYLIRMGSGFRKPRASVLGVDVAGRGNAVGQDVMK